MVHVACDPESNITCPLEHPLAVSTAAYLDENVKPSVMRGYEAVVNVYENKALPIWEGKVVPFWKEKAQPALVKTYEMGKDLWASKGAPFWDEKVVGNWDKHAAPHYDKYVVVNWNKFAAPHWEKGTTKASEVYEEFGENWPMWKSKSETFVREKWHTLAVLIVHDFVPKCYEFGGKVWDNSGIVLGKVWEKAGPIVEKGYAYLENSVDNLSKTETFVKIKESAFGKGVGEVYEIWRSGVQFLVDSVKCGMGKEEDKNVCGKVGVLFSDMGDYVTGKKKQ
jgi:hypothetical protein